MKDGNGNVLKDSFTYTNSSSEFTMQAPVYEDLSTSTNPERNAKEDIVLTALKEKFVLGNIDQLRWDLGSPYHKGEAGFHTVDLNRGSGDTDLGDAVYSPADGITEGVTPIAKGQHFASVSGTPDFSPHLDFTVTIDNQSVDLRRLISGSANDNGFNIPVKATAFGVNNILDNGDVSYSVTWDSGIGEWITSVNGVDLIYNRSAQLNASAISTAVVQWKIFNLNPNLRHNAVFDTSINSWVRWDTDLGSWYNEGGLKKKWNGTKWIDF
jgi:hypothetical protein